MYKSLFDVTGGVGLNILCERVQSVDFTMDLGSGDYLAFSSLWRDL